MHIRCQQHGSSPNQLKLPPQDWHGGQEAINVVYSQIKGLILELVLFSNLNQPVHQNGSHAVGDVWLLLHVTCFWPGFHLWQTRSTSYLQIPSIKYHLPFWKGLATSMQYRQMLNDSLREFLTSISLRYAWISEAYSGTSFTLTGFSSPSTTDMSIGESAQIIFNALINLFTL